MLCDRCPASPTWAAGFVHVKIPGVPTLPGKLICDNVCPTVAVKPVGHVTDGSVLLVVPPPSPQAVNESSITATKAIIPNCFTIFFIENSLTYIFIEHTFHNLHNKNAYSAEGAFHIFLPLFGVKPVRQDGALRRVNAGQKEFFIHYIY
jgi:hypothetical protein